MSTEHFSIHQGVFIFIRFDVNNRRSFCFGSFLFQIINDLPNHGNTFFFAVKTAFFHIFQIVTENFYQLCLFDVTKILPALFLKIIVPEFPRMQK